mgnify:CR=1 FL=1
MKAHIGKYRSWFGPYQLADLLEYVGVKDKDKRHEIGSKLADTWVGPFLSWVDSFKKRKVKVRIDDYDVWNMDTTLAFIVLPMLKILKEKKQGAPFVDDIDVPEELKSTSAPAKENEWDTDDNHFKRWDYVLDEMIFAFESKHNDWEDQFSSGNFDKVFVPINKAGEEVPEKEADVFRWDDGPNHTYKVDWDARNAYAARVAKGFSLFGKYYEGLWD